MSIIYKSNPNPATVKYVAAGSTKAPDYVVWKQGTAEYTVWEKAPKFPNTISQIKAIGSYCEIYLNSLKLQKVERKYFTYGDDMIRIADLATYKSQDSCSFNYKWLRYYAAGQAYRSGAIYLTSQPPKDTSSTYVPATVTGIPSSISDVYIDFSCGRNVSVGFRANIKNHTLYPEGDSGIANYSSLTAPVHFYGSLKSNNTAALRWTATGNTWSSSDSWDVSDSSVNVYTSSTGFIFQESAGSTTVTADRTVAIVPA